MHISETTEENEEKILCNKPVHENQLIGLNGEFHVVIPSYAQVFVDWFVA
jgi:hypothetical protein